MLLKFLLLKTVVFFLLSSLPVQATDSKAARCLSEYISVDSTEYGILLQNSTDETTLELLNSKSRTFAKIGDTISMPEESEVLAHMLNTLIYYRSVSKIWSPEKLEQEMSPNAYVVFFEALLRSYKKNNTKFNYFKRYLAQARPWIERKNLHDPNRYSN